MPSKRRYYYYGSFDDEVLEDDAKMQELEKEVGYPIEVTEDMYTNTEYGEVPEWVEVTIEDEGVLALRMARNMVGVIDGCRYVVMDRYFDVEVSKEWGGWGNCLLQIADRGGAYLEFHAKHSSESIEVNVTEQFNQAIGE
jgi:hypothetical protein